MGSQNSSISFMSSVAPEITLVSFSSVSFLKKCAGSTELIEMTHGPHALPYSRFNYA